MNNCPEKKTYRSQRLALSYLDWGNPGAPPLMLIHGSRDHARSWDRIAQQLSEQYRVIVPDLRGHGDSAWAHDGSYSLSSYVFDIHELICQLNLAPLMIVGHSLGGNIAIRTAGTYPNDIVRLVSIEGIGVAPDILRKQAAVPVDERMRKWISDRRSILAREPNRFPSIDDALKRMQAVNPGFPEDLARHLTQHGVRETDDGNFVWKFDQAVRLSPPDDLSQSEKEALWRNIACPILLIHGADSWASNPKEDGRASIFRNARVESIPKAGHWVHHDQSDQFLDLINKFLSV